MTGRTGFEKLLTPGNIGPVKTRNRIIKTGAAMLYCHEDELHMNKRMKAFHDAIARGGVGLLIVETPTVDYPSGARWRQRYRLDDDRYMEGLRELTQVIHRHGCPTFLQMNHDGPWQTKGWWDPLPVYTGRPVAASPVSLNMENDYHNEVPRELTIPEIKDLVDKFASAAVRAQKAGFDGVDINAGSSHLLHNFLSPYWNKRRDAYGGSLEKRTRFVVEIVQEIKKRLGRDFPVCVTINGIEIGRIIGAGDNECLNSEDGREIARILEKAGADAIQVRTHWPGYHLVGLYPEVLFYLESFIPLKSLPKELDWSHRGAGANIPLAAGIKKAVSIPVIVVGRLDPELGAEALREGKADFIGMTRRLLADPELPNKIAEGRRDDVAPCTACRTCFREPLAPKRCMVNAALGTEQPYITKRAGTRKRVVVVGSGPAGMEAARVAALRGHEAILYERNTRPGGLLLTVARLKRHGMEDLPALIRYLKGQLTRLGVKVMPGQDANLSVIEEARPDVVILATGGIPAIPDIAGIENEKVVGIADLNRAGERVIIIGGSIRGCSLAEYLVKRGKKVTIVETSVALGEGVVEHMQEILFSWFRKRGVTMMTGVKYEEITDKGLAIITGEGDRQLVEADRIIPALPPTPDNDLLKSLEGKFSEVYAVGDCREPGLIVDAIADGARIGRAI